MCLYGLPGRTHQASSAVSQPAVIREGSFLGARATVVALQHHLPARAERLQRWIEVEIRSEEKNNIQPKKTKQNKNETVDSICLQRTFRVVDMFKR